MTKLNNYNEFLETLREKSPQSDWPAALRALWWDAKDNWQASHAIAEQLHTDLGSWIHAYLHRKEGDEWNAGYWYRRANKVFPTTSLKEEHQVLVQYILES